MRCLAAYTFVIAFVVTLAGATRPPVIYAQSIGTRVLLITGGHSYDREALLQVFSDTAGISFTHIEHTEGTADAFDRADLLAYDVVVLYDMPLTITDAQKARFLSLFEHGVGVVATHHALVSYQRWPEYERIIGGRWFDSPEKGGTPGEVPSGYRHDVDFTVDVTPGHPITAGVTDFQIHDEVYSGYRVSPDATPLVRTSHPESGGALLWVRNERRSRVVYYLLGHGPSAFSNASYRALLANSIQWAARAR